MHEFVNVKENFPIILQNLSFHASDETHRPKYFFLERFTYSFLTAQKIYELKKRHAVSESSHRVQNVKTNWLGESGKELIALGKKNIKKKKEKAKGKSSRGRTIDYLARYEEVRYRNLLLIGNRVTLSGTKY